MIVSRVYLLCVSSILLLAWVAPASVASGRASAFRVEALNVCMYHIFLATGGGEVRLVRMVERQPHGAAIVFTLLKTI